MKNLTISVKSDPVELDVVDDYGGLIHITLSKGPHGLSIRVSDGTKNRPLLVDDDNGPMYECSSIGLCQHYKDPRSQEFKQWYIGGKNGRTYPRKAEISSSL